MSTFAQVWSSLTWATVLCLLAATFTAMCMLILLGAALRDKFVAWRERKAVEVRDAQLAQRNIPPFSATRMRLLVSNRELYRDRVTVDFRVPSAMRDQK